MIFNLQEGRMLVEKSMHLQTQTEWEEEMAYKVLRLLHDELYVELRFMGAALSELTPAPDKRLTTAATDGRTFFSPQSSFYVCSAKIPLT